KIDLLGLPRAGSVRAATTHPEDTPPAPSVTFRQEGEYWSIAHGSTIVRLKDSRGVQYIDREAATRHLDAALAMNSRLQAPVLVAYVQLARARLLLALPSAGDAALAVRDAQAGELAQVALATARRFGLAPL